MKRLNEIAEKIPYIGKVLTTKIRPEHLVAAIGVFIAGEAQAGGSLELLVGDKDARTDIKAYGTVTEDADLPTDKVGYFLRNRTSADYKGNSTFFAVGDTWYPIAGGFDALLEGQAWPGAGLQPRFGMQSFHKFGKLTLYHSSTRSVGPNPDTEVVVRPTFTPNISGDYNLFLRVEAITNIGDGQFNYATQRPRIGVQKGDTTVGVGVDMFQPKGAKGTINVGAFVEMRR